MLLNQELLNTLTAQAKASPRLRQNYDLRNSENDHSQRMLNALEPGTELPIHRHLHTSESVAMLRGKAVWIFYDDQGHETSRHLIEAGGENPGIVVPVDQYMTQWYLFYSQEPQFLQRSLQKFNCLLKKTSPPRW